MRSYNEPIHVKRDDGHVPAQFLWRGTLWVVRDVLTRWLETGAWWDSPLVRAARGDDVRPLLPMEHDEGETPDLLAEHEVWRVLAASGRGDPGVYEIDHARDTGSWRLRAVMD